MEIEPTLSLSSNQWHSIHTMRAAANELSTGNYQQGSSLTRLQDAFLGFPDRDVLYEGKPSKGAEMRAKGRLGKL